MPLAAIVRRAALPASFACAAVLLFAYYAQRTEWVTMGGRRGNRLLVFPDPSAWNLWVSVCGILAVAALLAGLWMRRWAVASALVATAAFAFAAFTSVGYWLGLSPDGVPPGRAALGPEWTLQLTSGPPVYAATALLGVAAALVLATVGRSLAPVEAPDGDPWPRGDGSDDAWFVRAVHRDLNGRPTAWREPARAQRVPSRDDGSGDGPLAVAFASGAFLLVAMFAPREAARTTWLGNQENTNDSPAGYVFLLGACGLAALVGLGIAVKWPRVRVVCALLATAALAYAAYRMVASASHLWSGFMGAEGNLNRTSPWPKGSIDAPEMLPFFLLAAVVGAAGALAYAVARVPRRTTRSDNQGAFGQTETAPRSAA